MAKNHGAALVPWIVREQGLDKVVLGLSGGVDSSVAAELLKSEYEVYALYLDTGAVGGAEAARKAAESAGIPLEVRNVREELEERVCAPFAEAYLRGETPNPCVLCNPAVKLRALCELADSLGARYIATGHYARKDAAHIRMGRPANDQSYMLCRIAPEQAARLLLPLGAYEKTEVRALAKELFLPSAKAPDSMEICFIPSNDYGAWLEKRGAVCPSGPIVYDGRVIGTHRGICHYTVGQGSGLGVALGHKVFVSGIDAARNRVELTEGKELWKTRITVRGCAWLEKPAAENFLAGVRVRHTRKPPVPCRVTLTENAGAVLHCAEPVRAPAPGQSAALYDGDLLLGGGFIVSSQ
jgi:tRNA (5-methylaminomethyl-2-thiouridylate)-methyltransferase